MYDDNKLKLIYIARKAEEYQLVSPGFGNFSFFVVGDNRILVTPSGKDRFLLRPNDIIVTDLEGNIEENINDNKPSIELSMHLQAYKSRTDIDTVIHTHSKHATRIASKGERVIFLSEVIKYNEPGSEELADSIREPIKNRDYLLLRNHGVLVVGSGMLETLEKAKYIEEMAKYKADS